MSLLEEVNARVAAKNAEILAARIAVYDKIDGPRIGDYMEFPDGKTFRIAHDWGDAASLQVAAAIPGASISAWDRCPTAADLRRPSSRHGLRLQSVIARGASGSSVRTLPGPGRGVHFQAQFRVFSRKSLKPTTDMVDGVPRYRGRGYAMQAYADAADE